MCFCWYQCGKDEVRAPLAWLKTHTERVPTTNAKAIELNSRLCLTVLHGPAWLAPDLCVCVACASVCVCVFVYVSSIVYVCCVLTVKREGVSEWASYRERVRQSNRERERGRANERMSKREAELERRHALSTVYWAHFLSGCPMSAQSVCVCTCLRVYLSVCIHVVEGNRPYNIFGLLLFVQRYTHTHTYRHAQTHAAMCLYVQPFKCTY